MRKLEPNGWRSTEMGMGHFHREGRDMLSTVRTGVTDSELCNVLPLCPIKRIIMYP